MKHLIKKVSASKSMIRAHFKMGHDVLNIVNKGTGCAGVLNGHEILKLSGDTLDSRSVHVLSDIIKCCTSRMKIASVSVMTDDMGTGVGDVVDNVKKDIGPEKVTIKIIPLGGAGLEKTLHSDFDVGSTADIPALMGALKDFVSTIREMTTILKVCHDDALTLTQGHMVGTMWGAKDMQDMLCGLREEIEGNSRWEKIEFFAGLIEKSIERLMLKLGTQLAQVCAEEKKVICNVLIPNIIDNFQQFKTAATDALLSLSSLVYIDTIFKKTTTYPATWFLSGGMLDDLGQDYQKLLGFIGQIPTIEKKIIYPLDFIKMKMINQEK